MPYQRRSPDYSQVVAEIARRFPAEWEAARERADGHREDAFIRRLAWELHQRDPNVGLNGKRGSDVISTDALSYRNPTGPGGVEVIDVIVGASHTPTWQDVTLPPTADRPDGVPGKFIQPVDPGGTDSGSSPGTPHGIAAAAFTVSTDLGPVLRPLQEEIRRLAQIVERQQAELEELRSRAQPLAPAPRLSGRVALRSAHGSYLTAEDDGRVTNRESRPEAWQTFQLETIGP